MGFLARGVPFNPRERTLNPKTLAGTPSVRATATTLTNLPSLRPRVLSVGIV